MSPLLKDSGHTNKKMNYSISSPCSKLAFRLIKCKYLQWPKNSTFRSEGGRWVVKSQEGDEGTNMGL